jgi:hypothetical protein
MTIVSFGSAAVSEHRGGYDENRDRNDIQIQGDLLGFTPALHKF